MAPGRRGSLVVTLVSVWPHREHSNVRCSRPSGPEETSAVIIRIWQSGQRGRWIGKSSGSGLGILGMIGKSSAAPKALSVRCPTKTQKYPQVPYGTAVADASHGRGEGAATRAASVPP